MPMWEPLWKKPVTAGLFWAGSKPRPLRVWPATARPTKSAVRRTRHHGWQKPINPKQYKPASSYLLTVHGEALASGELRAAACTDCHGAHTIVPPTDPGSKIAHQNIVKTCGQCHAEEAAIYQGSVHGKALAFGVREAPTCTDCHGEHPIRMPSEEGSSAWKGAITKTCSGCHASEKITLKFGLPPARVQTFLDSFHGLAGRAGRRRRRLRNERDG